MISFQEFVEVASSDQNFVAEFDRLQGTNLSRRGTGLDLAIDNATGRTKHDCQLWVDFCADLYQRLPQEVLMPDG